MDIKERKWEMGILYDHETNNKQEEFIFRIKREAEDRGLSGIGAEVFARWYVERFGEWGKTEAGEIEFECVFHPTDMNKWVNRFREHSHWHAMDIFSQRIYLKVLATNWRMTRSSLEDKASIRNIVFGPSLNDFIDTIVDKDCCKKCDAKLLNEKWVCCPMCGERV